MVIEEKELLEQRGARRGALDRPITYSNKISRKRREDECLHLEMHTAD